MSAQALEVFLAGLYTDESLRSRFLADAESVIADTDLAPADRAALLAIDRDGLVLAARSYAHKRNRRSFMPRSWWRRVFSARA